VRCTRHRSARSGSSANAQLGIAGIVEFVMAAVIATLLAGAAMTAVFAVS
jgi:hypothetical protein